MARHREPPRLRRARSGIWQIYHHDGSRTRQQSTGTRELGEAEAALARFLGEQRLGSPRGADAARVGDLIATFSREKLEEYADVRRVRNALMALNEFFGDFSVADITEPLCKKYVRDRSVASGTARYELSLLARTIRYNYQQGLLLREVHVWKPPPSRPRERWLTRDEFARLLWASRRHERLKRFLLVAIYTGARHATVCDLRWMQVDLKRRRLRLQAPDRAETSKGRPTLPLSPRLQWWLDRWWAKASSPRVVAEADATWPRVPHAVWRKAVERAGIAWCSPHDLRRTVATWMAQKGVDMWRIAGVLGHSVERTTQQYAVWSEDHLREAIESFERKR